jgi:putative transposase
MKTRVERHILNTSHTHYTLLRSFCFKSKNLYNYANYCIRARFIKEGKFTPYTELDKLLKEEGRDFDYRSMPTAQSAQQCLRLLEGNWKSFFASIKDWSRNKTKYTGKPRLPKYLKKDGVYPLVIASPACKLSEEGLVKFPKAFNGFTLKTKIAGKLQQVRILPRCKHLVIEVIYRVEVPEKKKDNQRVLGIDLGLDNFATITNNAGIKPTVINGKGLKSYNKYYNKKLAHYKKTAKQMNQLHWTNRLEHLTTKRNNVVDNFIHHASSLTIKLAKELNCNTIVVGSNKDWKRSSKMSKKVNQSFVSIPHQRYIDQLIYKAEDAGLTVITTEESYTSKCSFLDNEEMKKQEVYKGKRVKRGLFKSSDGILINADVNGAYNIIRKVFPNAFADGIEGVGLHPVKVDIM